MSIAREAILEGSVFLTLGVKAAEPKEILQEILKIGSNQHTHIAYKAICDSKAEQILEDGHFLESAVDDEFFAIYLQMGCSVLIKDSILTNIFRASLRMIQDVEFGTYIRIICDVPEAMGRLQPVHIPLIIRSRSYELLTSYAGAAFNSLMLATDQLDRIILPDINFPYLIVTPPNQLDFIGRIQRLAMTAPNYWEKVARPIYRDFIRKLFYKHHLDDLDYEKYLKLEEYIPGVFPQGLTSIPKNIFKLYYLSPESRAYILGFPIHNMIPSEEQIIQALILLGRLGPDGYMEYHKNYMEERYLDLYRNVHCQEPVMVNTESIYRESLFNYNVFDCVSFIAGKHMYTFTRMSFDSIILTRVNFYTGTLLPQEIISQIRTRIFLAKKMELPQPGTIKELIESALQEVEEESSDDDDSGYADDTESSPLLEDSTGLGFFNQLLE